MSAFDFMNKTNSHESFSSGLSSLLIEDLYDSQLDTFVNQPKPPKIKKETSYFSMIDDFAMASSAEKPENHFEQKSAFAFLSASSSPTTLSRSSVSYKASSKLSKAAHVYKIRPNDEMKLISATSTLRRVQAEKSNTLQTIQRLYKRHIQTMQQMQTLKSRISDMKREQEKALMEEDFLTLENLKNAQDKMTKSLYELSSSHALQTQIHGAWRELHEIMARESEAATHVSDCCEKVKQERHLQYMKFVTDNERMHQKRLQEIETGRIAIETEKSEVAFELGLWEQSNQDLVERKQDATFQLDLQKKDLTKEAQLVQTDIDNLKLKLNMLQSKKASLVNSMTEIDSVMHEKLLPFSQETLEHEQEYQLLDSKRNDIAEKEHILDEQETAIDADMSKHCLDKDGGLNELQAINEQMTEALELSQQGDTLDALLRFIELIEKRDQTITQHQSEIQASRESVQDLRNQLQDMQATVFGQQQQSIEIDESITELEHRLTSWQRHKQLAIDTGRFQNAAAWKDQMQSVQHELDRLKAQQKRPIQDEEIVEKQQISLELLVQQHEALVKEKDAEIKLILEQSKKDLSNGDLPLLIEQEVKSIQAQLQHE